MDRKFTVTQARQLLPEAVAATERLMVIRRELVEAQLAMSSESSDTGAIPQAKALEAQLHEIVEGLVQLGLQVKGIAPVLVDFPSVVDGQDGLLCWLEREPDLAYWHPVELGFMGRRPLPDQTPG